MAAHMPGRWMHLLLMTAPWAGRYMSSNPQYADSSTYAGKFRQLQARAMATMRSKVQQVLRAACDQVRSHTHPCCWAPTHL